LRAVKSEMHLELEMNSSKL